MRREIVTERLKTLEDEYRKGQQMLSELDQRRSEVRDTLLRIAGAIQVLKELSAEQAQSVETLAVA
jgi:prefoldin subunit 5